MTTKLKRNPNGGALIPTSAIGAAHRTRREPSLYKTIRVTIRSNSLVRTDAIQLRFEFLYPQDD